MGKKSSAESSNSGTEEKTRDRAGGSRDSNDEVLLIDRLKMG